ncbi:MULTISPECIES: DUF4435 domain-containing protein [unclassified Pseudomonas]|uniref:DUF4435 domain-containing protein n=1 Tax=unclassified Pseudomonas TaxID=196821 RepID=UPI000C88A7B3|nr:MULTISPECIES: DUF4435 domain-containing protein [unclassified Pseudomonas]PNA02034.1 hypothetical protein C1X28_24620 [Pseudomonas sp. FW305-BF15]PNB78077.1 hypothetical protein C1X30_25340 [Pseudomonas sp. FW305-BF6]
MNIDKMRASRNNPQVALISYTTVRGKNPEKLICVFEGYDDLPYYETVFNRVGRSIEFASIVAKGKDQVLALRQSLQNNHYQDDKVRFFVDHDFDGLKGYDFGDDIYVTEGYSIENHLADSAVLSSLLNSEFKCCEGDEDSVKKINILFDDFLAAFFEIMRPVNQAIFYARTHDVKLANIEDRISEYFLFTLENITDKKSDYFQLIGWPVDLERDTSSVEGDFSKLDPHMQWRGKFIFELFIKFLHQLKCDRTSNAPTLFAKKAGVKFDPNGEIIRSLASLSTIPPSLSAFVAHL